MSLLSEGELNSHWDAATIKLTDSLAEQLPAALATADLAIAGAGDSIRSHGRMLAIVCAKVAPTLSTAQVDAWVSATLTALSDLPADLVAQGLQKAVHTAMQFPSEIEGVVREAIGEELMRRHRVRNRLKDLQARAERPAKGAERATPAEVDEIMARYGIPSSGEGEYPPNKNGWRKGLNLRMPTVADYMALGVSQEAAERAVGGQTRARAA